MGKTLNPEGLNLRKDTWVTGLALFAMWFGAGNLIFPPYLGVLDGSNVAGIIAYIIGDAVLAALGILASSKFVEAGDIKGIAVLSRTWKWLDVLLGCLMVFFICPVFVVPRTCATAFEVAIKPFAPNFSPVIFAVIYFALTFFFMFKSSKVIDYIGKILTPGLLIFLVIMIVKGIVDPIGSVGDPQIKDVFANGLMNGYQTMDAMGGTLFGVVVLASINSKGYTDSDQKSKLLAKAGIIGTSLLAVIYIGLYYLGACVGSQYDSTVEQTTLLVNIVQVLMGKGGLAILAVIVLLACLTSAIGVAAAGCEYFTEITNGKLKYEWLVIGFCVLGAVLSVMGVQKIILIAVPILEIVYPPFIAMVLLGLFSKFIKRDMVFNIAALVAFAMGICQVAGLSFVNAMPLASFGLGWIVPAAVGAVIGAFIPGDSRKLNTPNNSNTPKAV